MHSHIERVSEEAGHAQNLALVVLLRRLCRNQMSHTAADSRSSGSRAVHAAAVVVRYRIIVTYLDI